MEFVTIRDLKYHMPQVLRLSGRQGPVVVTRRGRPVAVLRAAQATEIWRQFDEVWEQIRQAARRSGVQRKDVERLIAQARAEHG